MPESLKLVHVLTSPLSLGFLRGQLRYMTAQGIEVQLVASVDRETQAAFAEAEGVTVHAVPMTRAMTPFADALALWRLHRLLRSLAPDIVHAGTPKGGFLGIVAATAAGVPVRVYHMHGIRGMTVRGWRRRILLTTEWIACRLSSRVLCVGDSLRQTALDEGLCPAEKIVVLGAGSCNGVDARGRFDPGRFDAQALLAARHRLDIPATAPVLGFVGRIVRDKGVDELAAAWTLLAAAFPALHLIVVGTLESEDPAPDPAVAALRDHPRVRFVPWVQDPSLYYALMEVVALPTYREGLPNVPLEAAAMRLPVVASRVTGCVDAVVDGITGTLVPPADPSSLAGALALYLRDASLRSRHGAAGRQRVLREFVPEDLWQRVHELYLSLLPPHGQSA